MRYRFSPRQSLQSTSMWKQTAAGYKTDRKQVLCFQPPRPGASVTSPPLFLLVLGYFERYDARLLCAASLTFRQLASTNYSFTADSSRQDTLSASLYYYWAMMMFLAKTNGYRTSSQETVDTK